MRRFGVFHIGRHFIDNEEERARELFKHLSFIPIRAEMLYNYDCVEYIGLSPRFDEIEDGTTPPMYKIGVQENQDKRVMSITVERCK